MKMNPKKKLSWFARHKIALFLTILCVIAFALRFYRLSQNLFFGPEQGIDFLKIKDIVINHSPVLVGAKTDIGGIFHGPIYYYVAVIPFLISHGDPLFVAAFLIILNSLTVFLIYRLASELYNRRAGFLSAILFTLSFGAISYSRWLSSHPFTIPLSCIFFLGIVLFLKGKKRYLLLASISYGLIGQSEFLNYLFFGVMLILIVIIYRKNFWKEKKLFLLVNLLTLIIVGFSNFILFELRNSFIMTKSIVQLQSSSGYHLTIIHSIQLTFDVFMDAMGKLFMPSSAKLGFMIFVVGLILIFLSKKSIAKKILSVWLLTPVILLIALRHDVLEQFFVYAIVPGILINAFVWESLIAWKRYAGWIIFAIVAGFYLFVWYANIPNDNNMFYESTQPDINIRDEHIVIDKIYKQTNGKNFSFQSYTIPYWSQQGWEYLFWQRGAQKYGYLPVNLNGKILFVIVQDDPSGKRFQDDWLKHTVTKWGIQISSFRQGVFTVLVLKVK